MEAPELSIAREIEAYIKRGRISPAEWYAGVSSDPRRRLFDDHKVDKEVDLWFYRRASNAHSARWVEKYPFDFVGTEGGPGGGDSDAVFVYAYQKTESTLP
jgi:hypothetical protein